jgi:hypothetical protein
MDIPMLSHEELRQWLEFAINVAPPAEFARHVMGIAEVLQLDTAVELAGQGLGDLVGQIAGALQIDLHRSLNGGW